MGRQESRIERYLDERVKEHGGFTRKVVYQGRSGSPDRWCFFPNGRLLIVELKRPREKPEEHQLIEMQALRNRGQFVAWTNTKDGVDRVIVAFLNQTVFNIGNFNEEFPL